MNFCFKINQKNTFSLTNHNKYRYRKIPSALPTTTSTAIPMDNWIKSALRLGEETQGWSEWLVSTSFQVPSLAPQKLKVISIFSNPILELYIRPYIHKWHKKVNTSWFTTKSAKVMALECSTCLAPPDTKWMPHIPLGKSGFLNLYRIKGLPTIPNTPPKSHHHIRQRSAEAADQK